MSTLKPKSHFDVCAKGCAKNVENNLISPDFLAEISQFCKMKVAARFALNVVK